MKNKKHILIAGILIFFGVVIISIFVSGKIDNMSAVPSTEESTDISNPEPEHVALTPNKSALMEDYEHVSSFAFVENFGPPPGITCFLSYENGILSANFFKQESNKFDRPISDDEFQSFVEIFKKYNIFDWRTSRDYWDLLKGADPLNYICNPDANYLKMGKFYCAGSNGLDNQLYMGLGEDEELARNMYISEWRISIENNNHTYIKQYQSYGVPENYNEFREELWDFALKLLDVPDWRKNIEQSAREGLIREYPYMGGFAEGKPDYNKMWYFSLNEFYGGFESGIYSSLIFDKYEHVTLQEEGSVGMLHSIKNMDWDVYYIDKDGVPQFCFKQNDEIDSIMIQSKYSPKREYIDEEKKQKLIDILEKYDIAQWEEGDFYAAQPGAEYVKQGDFFSLSSSPDADHSGIDEEEYQIRSTYKSYIYLNDTDGKRWMISYDNFGVPEEYNAFRQELWDYAVECFYEEYMGDNVIKKSLYDRRAHLDEEGRAYLEWKKAKQ